MRKKASGQSGFYQQLVEAAQEFFSPVPIKLLSCV